MAAIAIITLISPSILPLAEVAPVALPPAAPLPEAFDALALDRMEEIAEETADAEAVLEARLADAEEEALRRDEKEGSWTGGLAALQIPWAVDSVVAWSAAEQLAKMQGATVARNWLAVQKQWTYH